MRALSEGAVYAAGVNGREQRRIHFTGRELQLTNGNLLDTIEEGRDCLITLSPDRVKMGVILEVTETGSRNGQFPPYTKANAWVIRELLSSGGAAIQLIECRKEVTVSRILLLSREHDQQSPNKREDRKRI